jgi:hypothetical protein
MFTRKSCVTETPLDGIDLWFVKPAFEAGTTRPLDYFPKGHVCKLTFRCNSLPFRSL